MSFTCLSKSLKRSESRWACAWTTGPKNISGKLQTWAAKRGIGIFCIQPGKPQQYAYVERYNRTVRQEWPGRFIFNTIEKVKEHATRWLWIYNNQRPDMGIGGITPPWN